MFSSLQHCDFQQGAVLALLSGLSQLLGLPVRRKQILESAPPQPSFYQGSVKMAMENRKSVSFVCFSMFRVQLFVLFAIGRYTGVRTGVSASRTGIAGHIKSSDPWRGLYRMVTASRDTILSVITVVIIIVHWLHILRARHLRGLHIWLPPVRAKLRFVCSHQSVAVVPSILVLERRRVPFKGAQDRIRGYICGKDETRPSEETKIGSSLFKPMHAISRIIQTQTVEQAFENMPYWTPCPWATE